MHLFLAPECAPFAIAAMILIGLTAIEILSMLLGFSLSELIGKPHFEGHDGVLAGLLSWINIGGVPLLILIMLALGIFAVTGFAIQTVADVIRVPLPAIAAAVPALAITIPLVRGSTRMIARIVPRDETYAVEADDFVGRTGTVSIGPLDQGLPGRVSVKDAHGNWHQLRASAAKDESPLPIGAQVLLVDRKADIFIAVSAPSDLVRSDDKSSTEQPS
ncbi:membrane protein implicated in regulation of membrane protease activity [Rhizobium sp. ERR 922]|uniref:OB-fold-containig protein n=1 Tax=unclassified Rhizobium TaxID=2613769 RepID=UPI00119D632C|nr:MULTISPECIES: OB-fold-containig protein [unclassified Rhizobium]TWB61180.1 membrane protein implicated in regulation of membrane protease activity [Rhizobium sp. ERR 922]TWC04106.1 membrane protein implicated in regulation of membrane protease activity [Rhizobium sp. ERR 942]